jgi:hypothetical protein
MSPGGMNEIAESRHFSRPYGTGKVVTYESRH